MNFFKVTKKQEDISERTPDLLGAYSRNTSTLGKLLHTFTESGTFQFIVLERNGDGQAESVPIFFLNNTRIYPTNTYNLSSFGAYFYYDEITVSEGDVLSVENSAAYSNSALQLAVFKDADLTNFNVIGYRANNSQTFNLPNDKWIYQVYKTGYYQGLNTFNYRVERHMWKNASEATNYQYSLATPSGDGHFYYGFTIAITI